MTTQLTKITALYCRLSQEDMRGGDSISIENQKTILSAYADKNGFKNPRFFVDDGVSGTVFNRQGLNAMLEQVKSGNVGTVIIKDQSRIGRDVLEVGLLKRTFEEYNVRFIAAEDGLDSAKGFDIMSLIRDVINEFYVADCSAKIRAVKRSNALAGKCAGRPPYGYKAINGSNQEWEIDEEVVGIVQEIFSRIIAGDGPQTIARDFHSRGIDPPLVHYRKRKGLPPLTRNTAWVTYIVSHICENRAYIGQMVSQRVTTPSYKNRKKFVRPEEDWVIVENHHPPIIDYDTFELVQRIRANRRRPTKRGDFGVMSGLLYCVDCQSKLAIHGTHNGKYQYYTCSLYRNRKKFFETQCSGHNIRRDVIEEIAITKIREILKCARENKEAFADQIRKQTQKENEKAIKSKTSQLAKADNQITELDNTIKRIYIDNVAGRLSNERFDKMLGAYEAEQKGLVESTADLRQEVEELRNRAANVQSFINLASRYTDIPELTADIAHTFIDKILVHEAVYTKNKKQRNPRYRNQEVQIFYTCIGEFEVPEAEVDEVPEEMEASEVI